MICVTLTENGIEEGIDYLDFPYKMLQIGDRHPDCRFTTIGFGEYLQDTYEKPKLDRCFVHIIRATGRPLIVEENYPDSSILIRICVTPGLGGSINLTAPTYKVERCLFQGMKLEEENLRIDEKGQAFCEVCSERCDVEVDEEGPLTYSHTERGTLRVFDPMRRGHQDFNVRRKEPGSIFVYAEGEKPSPPAANGAGGERLYSEVLLELTADTSIRIARSGDLMATDGASWSEKVYYWTGTNLVPGHVALRDDRL